MINNTFSAEFIEAMIETQEEFLHSVDAFSSRRLMDETSADYCAAFKGNRM